MTAWRRTASMVQFTVEIGVDVVEGDGVIEGGGVGGGVGGVIVVVITDGVSKSFESVDAAVVAVIIVVAIDVVAIVSIVGDDVDVAIDVVDIDVVVIAFDVVIATTPNRSSRRDASRMAIKQGEILANPLLRLCFIFSAAEAEAELEAEAEATAGLMPSVAADEEDGLTKSFLTLAAPPHSEPQGKHAIIRRLQRCTFPR